MAIPKIQEFRYRVLVNGMDAALCQSVTPGQRKNGIMKIYGGGMNHPHKEPGQVEFDDMELEYVIPISGSERGFWTQLADGAQNPETGYGDSAMPAIMLTIQDLDNQMNPVRSWDYFNCLVSVHDPGKRDASSIDKPLLEKVHIAYDFRKPSVM